MCGLATWVSFIALRFFSCGFGRRSLALYLIFPVLGLVLIVSAQYRAPFWFGYYVNRPAMDDVATAVMAGKRDPGTINWIGLYPVYEVDRERHGVAFYVNGTGSGWNYFWDMSGFLYSMVSPPRAKEFGYCTNEPLQHLSGDWYLIYSPPDPEDC